MGAFDEYSVDLDEWRWIINPVRSEPSEAFSGDQPHVLLNGVSKSFDGQSVIQAFDLVVPSGATVALIGPSGCGKSTLLRLMNGLLMPDAGQVCISGQPLSPKTILGLRQRMGYVIQEGGLFPHLSARRNVSLMAEHLGWEATRIDARLSELADLTHLPSELLERFPTQLSGGQRQRVALMRALMLDPELMLLDEPLGALDPIIRYDLQGELKRIFRTLGKTLVLVTHDLAEAAYLADDIVLLRAGRIVQRGQMQELLEHPAEPFVDQFVRAQRGHGRTEPS